MLTPEQLEYLRGMRFEESCGDLSVGSDAIVAHIYAQQERIAELEQDAARYRWLRNASMNERNMIEHYASFALDSAIDNAKQK